MICTYRIDEGDFCEEYELKEGDKFYYYQQQGGGLFLLQGRSIFGITYNTEFPGAKYPVYAFIQFTKPRKSRNRWNCFRRISQ